MVSKLTSNSLLPELALVLRDEILWTKALISNMSQARLSLVSPLLHLKLLLVLNSLQIIVILSLSLEYLTKTLLLNIVLLLVLLVHHLQLFVSWPMRLISKFSYLVERLGEGYIIRCYVQWHATSLPLVLALVHSS